MEARICGKGGKKERKLVRCGTEVPRDRRSAKYRCGKNNAPFSATTRLMHTKRDSYG